MKSLFSELKRRNVLRLTGLYLVGSWLLLQVANVVLPVFGVPAWVLQALILTLAIGFVPALLLAWVFELTPDGLKRDRELAPGEAMAPRTARRIDRMIVAGLCLVIALLLADRLWWRAAQAHADAGLAAPALGLRSLVVLPFVNVSADPEQEFFSDGITEELLNALSRLPDVKVVGRTSSFAFKGKNQDLREIGKALGVGHILEGSVRKQGGRVRISAQLVQASDGFRLWSDSFDRELSDIFAVQDEITTAIVSALRPELGASSPRATATAPIAAYTLYLQARQILALRGAASVTTARKMFEQVIALAPNYSPAFSALGQAILLEDIYGTIVSSRSSLQASLDAGARGKEAARNALALDPFNAEAHSVLGSIAWSIDWDWQTAGQEIARSLELAPNDAEILNFAGDYFGTVLNPTTLTNERLAIALNPTHAVNYHDLGLACLVFGDAEGSVAAFAAADALGFYAQSPEMLWQTLWPLLKLQRIAQAKQVVARMGTGAGISPAFFVLGQTSIALAEGETERSNTLLRQLEDYAVKEMIPPTLMAWALMLAGRSEESAQWIERAYEVRDWVLIEPSRLDLPEHLPDHPAIRAALDKPELNALFELRRRNLSAAASGN